MLLHTDVVPHTHEALSLPAAIAVAVVALLVASAAVAFILRRSN